MRQKVGLAKTESVLALNFPSPPLTTEDKFPLLVRHPVKDATVIQTVSKENE